MSNNNHKTSHHQFATISLGAYPDENVIVDGLNKYKTSNDYNLSTNGFYAEIYINEVSKEINFSFRGTNGIVDVDDDYSLYKQDIPEQFSINSKSYIDQSLSDLGQSYNLSDFTINTTGHSLGGVLSSLSGVYIYSQGYNFGQSVAFDAPATTTNMIQQVAGDNFLTLNPNLQSKFTNYVASPNLVNTTNGDQHYANLVMFEFENQDINPSGFIWIDDYKDFTKDQHSASNFLDKFDPVTGEPINGIPINSWFNLREGYEYFKSYESNKQYWDNYIDSKWNSNPIWHQGSVDGDGSDILRLQDVFKDKESYKELFIKLHLSDLEIDVKEIEVSINNIGGILTNQQKVEIIQEIKTLQNVDLQDKTVTFKNPDGSFEIYRIDGNLINIANQYEVDLNSILISSANNTGFDNLSDREIIADNGGSMYVYRIDEVIKVPNDNRQYNGKIEITHTDNDFDYVSTIPKEQQNEYLYNLFQDVATVKSYIVELGDTLGKIALENNTTIDKILELNNIENIDKIQAGQVIKLNDTEALKKIKLNEDSYNISTKDQEATLKNSGLLAENPEYIDKNGNAISQQEAIFTVEDSNGNINTIQKEGVMTTLKDGTKALLSAVVEMTEKAADVTKEFVDGYMNQANKLFTTGDGIASLINNIIIIKRLMQH